MTTRKVVAIGVVCGLLAASQCLAFYGCGLVHVWHVNQAETGGVVAGEGDVGRIAGGLNLGAAKPGRPVIPAGQRYVVEEVKTIHASYDPGQKVLYYQVYYRATAANGGDGMVSTPAESGWEQKAQAEIERLIDARIADAKVRADAKAALNRKAGAP